MQISISAIYIGHNLIMRPLDIGGVCFKYSHILAHLLGLKTVNYRIVFVTLTFQTVNYRIVFVTTSHRGCMLESAFALQLIQLVVDFFVGVAAPYTGVSPE